MIGMSSGFGSIWNPRAKGKPQLQMNTPMPLPTGNPMMSPMGMQASFPPIAPSRNLLNRHMALPMPDMSPEVQPDDQQNKMPRMRMTQSVRRGIF